MIICVGIGLCVGVGVGQCERTITPEWDCNPFLSDSIVFNENSIARVVAALTLTLGVNGPLMFTFSSDRDQRKKFAFAFAQYK